MMSDDTANLPMRKRTSITEATRTRLEASRERRRLRLALEKDKAERGVQKLSDEVLRERAINGDDRAFEILMNRHEGLIKNITQKITRGLLHNGKTSVSFDDVKTGVIQHAYTYMSRYPNESFVRAAFGNADKRVRREFEEATSPIYIPQRLQRAVVAVRRENASRSVIGLPELSKDELIDVLNYHYSRKSNENANGKAISLNDFQRAIAFNSVRSFGDMDTLPTAKASGIYEQVDPLLDVERHENDGVVREAVEQLTGKQQRILIPHFGFDTGEPKRSVDIASELGLDPTAVPQAIKYTLGILRNPNSKAGSVLNREGVSLAMGASVGK